MANIRGFKKDINYVVNEIVIESFTYNYLFPEKHNDELAKIISDTIVMGDELLKNVNSVKPSKDNPAKKQFIDIRKSFLEQTEGFVERLEKLEK